jgi:hypothetical protein
MREVKLTLWGLVLLSSLCCGSGWIAIHALWRLQAAGQSVWSFVWPGLLFGAGMGFFIYIDRR